MSTLKADSIQPTNSGNNLIFKTGAGDAERMRINTSGFVGIGTSNPVIRLDIVNTLNTQQAQIQFANTGSGGNAQIGHDLNGDMYLYETPTGKSMRFGTNSTERLRITSDGKVGIANASPAVALDVVGSIKTDTGLVLGGATFDAPSGTAPLYGCRAYAKYDVTGTSATTGVLVPLKTNNLTFTRPSTGTYVGTFNIPMPDANYVVLVSVGGILAAGQNVSMDHKIHVYGNGIQVPTASSFAFTTFQDGVGTRDVENFSVAVFA